MKHFALAILLAVLSFPVSSQEVTISEPDVFRLGPGDQILIDVLGEPELTRESQILPDGTITYPYLRAMNVAGMTPQELDDALTEALAGELIEPEVTVTVRTQSARQIYLFGQVNREGAMVLSQPTSLMRALALSGSFNRMTANLKEVYVLRQEGEERVPYRHNLEEFLKQGGTAGDVMLEPEDIIYVPEKIDRIFVIGEVFDPGVYPHSDGLTALGAIGMARGPRDSAAMRSVILIRNPESAQPEHRRLNLYRAETGGDLSENLILKSGDILIVPKQFIARVSQFVRQWLVESAQPIMGTYSQAYDLRNLPLRTDLLKAQIRSGSTVINP